MVTIRNLTKRTLIFNLPHDKACSEETCKCTRRKVGTEQHDPATGDRTLRVVNQRLAASITLFPKGMRDADEDRTPLDAIAGLHGNIRRVPEIIHALRESWIEIIHDPPAVAEPATASPLEQSPPTKKKPADTAAKE